MPLTLAIRAGDTIELKEHGEIVCAALRHGCATMKVYEYDHADRLVFRRSYELAHGDQFFIPGIAKVTVYDPKKKRVTVVIAAPLYIDIARHPARQRQE